MQRPIRLASLALGFSLVACLPPRERVDGRSADGATRIALDLRPVSVDSVTGSGTLRVDGRPHVVVLRGKWKEIGDGRRSLDATLQGDATSGERWMLEWSPSELEGVLRDTAGPNSGAAVALSTQ